MTEYRLYWPEKRRGWHIVSHAHSLRGTLVGLAKLRKGNSKYLPEDYADCRLYRYDLTLAGTRRPPLPLP